LTEKLFRGQCKEYAYQGTISIQKWLCKYFFNISQSESITGPSILTNETKTMQNA